MSDNRKVDPTRQATKLRTRLRGLERNETMSITPAEQTLFDRGLCSLIDNYATGKANREFVERTEGSDDAG